MAALLLRRWITVCSVVCVLALAFFPLPHGSFQATHGPTTAFRFRWSFLLLLGIVTALMRGLTILSTAMHRLAGLWIADLRLKYLHTDLRGQVMRC
ncbi:MAG: hypothetical protein LAP21_19525 [Acidobacteriia bacterium]|nr:hypothetical protein [Terriglobia bacterium]